MRREYAPSFAGPWRAHLDALALARSSQHTHSAAMVRWYLLAGVVFVALWAQAGYTTAIYALAGSMGLLLTLTRNGRAASPRAGRTVQTRRLQSRHHY